MDTINPQVDNTQTIKKKTIFPGTVREYTKKDKPKVLELLQLVYKRESINSDYMKWKYYDNPLGKHVIVVTEYNNQIVGTSSGYYHETKIGNNMHLTRFGGDLAVHPEYRKRGINNKMTALSDELRTRDGIQISIGVTSNPIVINNRNKRGFPPFPKKLFEMVYIKNVGKQNLGLIKGLGYQVYKSVQKISRNNKTNYSDINISETKYFGKEADLFWHTIKDHYNLMVKRDSSFLNWRYCDPRTRGYKVFTAMVNGIMCGYCVILGNKNNLSSTGYIVDLCVLPEMNMVTRGLLEKAIKTLECEVNQIKYLVVEGHPIVPVFSSYGFAPIVSNLDVRIIERHKNVRDDLAVFYQSSSEKIFLQYGDIDLF